MSASSPQPGVHGTRSGRPVVFYDGVCALCNRMVRFLLRRDRRGVLAFAPLQGRTFEALASRAEVSRGLDSMVYVRDHRSRRPTLYVRSEATLQILRDLGGFWRVISWARIIPRFVRDPIYDFVARHRYRWFGRYESCRLPADGEPDRMLP